MRVGIAPLTRTEVAVFVAAYQDNLELGGEAVAIAATHVTNFRASVQQKYAQLCGDPNAHAHLSHEARAVIVSLYNELFHWSRR